MTEKRRHRHPRDESGDEGLHDNQRRYSLDELTERAGVTTRTVRYYITEGLLPPPDGAGPRSTYSDTHLERLRLISRLKDAYLPLREIRRQLHGMTDQDIVAALDDTETLSSDTGATSRESTPDDRELFPGERGNPGGGPERFRGRHRGHRRGEDMRPGESPYAPDPDSLARILREGWAAGDFRGGPRGRRGYRSHTVSDRSPSEMTDSAAAGTTDTNWKRLAIAPEAELLIETETYHRRQEQIDAAIDWLRRILES